MQKPGLAFIGYELFMIVESLPSISALSLYTKRSLQDTIATPTLAVTSLVSRWERDDI